MAGRLRLSALFVAGLLTVLVLPLITRSASEDLAAIPTAATNTWPDYQGEGLRLRLPPGLVNAGPNYGIAGVHQAGFAAETCPEPARAGCQSEDWSAPLMLGLSLTRTANPAVPAPDDVRADLRLAGFTERAVSVGDYDGMLFSAADRAEQHLLIEYQDVLFWMRFPSFLYDDPAAKAQILAQMLGTLELRPAEAPALPGNEPEPESAFKLWLPLLDIGGVRRTAAPIPASADVTLSQSATVVRYNLEAAAQYARNYRNLLTNRDNCYIYTYLLEDRPDPEKDKYDVICSSDPKFPSVSNPTRADAVHFVACALFEGSLAYADGTLIPRCNRLNSWYRYHPSRSGDPNAMLSVLDTLPTRRFNSDTMAAVGDLLILYPTGSSEACWGGIVTEQDVTGTWVSFHSDISGGNYARVQGSFLQCYNNGGNLVSTRREYISFITDSTPPTVSFVEPAATNVPYGHNPLLQWVGSDGPDGSGIAGYTLTRQISGRPVETLVNQQLLESSSVSLTSPCRTITFTVTAYDNADLASEPDTLIFQVGLPGDITADGAIAADDVAAVELAQGLRVGDQGYTAVLDINADKVIDAADLQWMIRHQGDRCP